MDSIQASIIIPTLNKLSRLRLVLKSLESQITKQIEVIIVFDGCDPSVIEEFHQLNFSFTPIEVICPTNVGRSSARNRGIEVAHGKIVIFLDDDRITCPNFVQAHLNAHKHRHVAVLGYRPDVYLTDEQINDYFTHYEDCIDICNKNSYTVSSHKYLSKPFPWLTFFTGNVSVRRDDLLKVGCFDENFKGWGHEDIDLGIRLHNKRIPVIYALEATNYHMMHASNFSDNRKSSLRNIKYMKKKYIRNPSVFLYYTILGTKHRFLGIYVNRHLTNAFKNDKK